MILAPPTYHPLSATRQTLAFLGIGGMKQQMAEILFSLCVSQFFKNGITQVKHKGK